MSSGTGFGGGAASWLPGPADGPGAPPPGAGQQFSGWVAPPRPGLIPLRPLEFGELLAASFRLLRFNTKVSVGSAVLVTAVTTLLSGLATGLVAYFLFDRAESASPADRDQLLVTAAVGTALTALVAVVISIIATALLQGVLVHVVTRAVVGERPGFASAWRAAGRRAWPLVGYSALVGVITLAAVGLVAAVVIVPLALADGETWGTVVAVLVGLVLGLGVLAGALLIGVKILFVPSAIVLEQRRPVDAFRRSWRLSSGRFWRILGVSLLVQLIASFAAGAVTGVLELVVVVVPAILVPLGVADEGTTALVAVLIIGLSLLLLAVQTVVTALTLVLTAGNAVLLYLDARMRNEGLNLQLQRYVDERAAGHVPSVEPFTHAAPPAWRPRP